MTGIIGNGIDAHPGRPIGAVGKHLIERTFNPLQIIDAVFDGRIVAVSSVVNLKVAGEGVDPVFDHPRVRALVLGQCCGLLRPHRLDEHGRSGLQRLCDGAGRTLGAGHRGQPGQHVVEFWLGFQSNDQRYLASALWVRSIFLRDDHPLYNFHHHVLGFFLVWQAEKRDSNYSRRLVPKFQRGLPNNLS